MQRCLCVVSLACGLCLLAGPRPPSLARMFQPLPQSQASQCPPDTFLGPSRSTELAKTGQDSGMGSRQLLAWVTHSLGFCKNSQTKPEAEDSKGRPHSVKHLLKSGRNTVKLSSFLSPGAVGLDDLYLFAFLTLYNEYEEQVQQLKNEALKKL